jgi:hypothetical protein
VNMKPRPRAYATKPRKKKGCYAITPHSAVYWIDAKLFPAHRCADEYVLVWLDTSQPTIPVATVPLALGYQDGDQWFYAGTTEEILSPVTHWAPIPAGPVKECEYEALS